MILDGDLFLIYVDIFLILNYKNTLKNIKSL